MPLVLLLLLILPLKRHPLWTDSGGAFTGTKYLGAVCFVYAAVHLVMRGKLPRYLATAQARWYVAFFLLLVISYILTPAGLTAFDAILGPASLFLLSTVLLSTVDSLKRLRLVLLAVIASVGWASVYVIREWVRNRGWATGSRAEWVVGDSNHFAISALCIIPLAWYVVRAVKPGWERWLCRTSMVLALAAIGIGGSRGGLLGLVIVMFVVAARSRKRTLNIIAVIAVILAFNVAYPHSPLQRLLHPDTNDRGSELAHRASWEAGLNMIRQHPFTGVGLSAFRPEMLQYAPQWYTAGRPFMAHSAYISVCAELGIPGLLMFVIILAATYRRLGFIRRSTSAPRLLREVAAGLRPALLGASISIAFISAEYHEYLWLMIFLSMCLEPFARRLRPHANHISSSSCLDGMNSAADSLACAAPYSALDR